MSSMVMIRSSLGIYWDRAFKNVVFPDPVPPLMKMLYPARTRRARNPTTSGLTDCQASRSFMVMASLGNFRMVTMGPFRATGARTTLTREPSGSLASTMGLASLTSRLDPATICWITSSSFSLDRNLLSDWKSRPFFSRKMLWVPLIMISVISSSSRNSSRRSSLRKALKSSLPRAVFLSRGRYSCLPASSRTR